MTTTAMTSLTDLAGKLERHLNNTASFSSVSTRVLLRTGVNLRAPKPEQIKDAAAVSKVAAALTEMGYRL